MSSEDDVTIPYAHRWSAIDRPEVVCGLFEGTWTPSSNEAPPDTSMPAAFFVRRTHRRPREERTAGGDGPNCTTGFRAPQPTEPRR